MEIVTGRELYERIPHLNLLIQLSELRGGVDFFEDRLTELGAQNKERDEALTAELSAAERVALEAEAATNRYAAVSFPQTLRRSAFLTAFAAFEHYLQEEARMQGRLAGSVLRLKDLTGRGILQAETYLRRALALPFPVTPAWENIKNYLDLRNQLMHRGTHLREDDFTKKLEKAYTPFSNINVKVNSQVRMDASFVRGCIANYLVFSRDLRTALSLPAHLRARGSIEARSEEE